MALQKTIIKNNGVEMSYHRITSVDLIMVETNSNDEDSLRLIIRLQSYLNKEYRDKNCPIDSEHYMIPITTDEGTEVSGIRQFAYDKLKELPEWSDAVDC